MILEQHPKSHLALGAGSMGWGLIAARLVTLPCGEMFSSSQSVQSWRVSLQPCRQVSGGVTHTRDLLSGGKDSRVGADREHGLRKCCRIPLKDSFVTPITLRCSLCWVHGLVNTAVAFGVGVRWP